MRILSKKYLCLSVLVMELTSKELADSQELTSMLMEIIDFGFLEKSPNILVLEIRKILTLYDDNGVRHKDLPPIDLSFIHY